MVRQLLPFIFLPSLTHALLAQATSDEERIRKSRLWANYGMEVNTIQDALRIFEKGLYFETVDSLEKARTAYRLVFYFDSTAAIAGKALAKLDSIAQLYPNRLQNKLLGSWRWIGSGSNWGSSDGPEKCKCEKSIVFDKTKVYFLEGNEVKSSYEYYLKTISPNIRWPIYYLIDVPGLKEKWTTGFGPQWWPVASEYSLTINRMYNCACGCPEEYFEKITYY